MDYDTILIFQKPELYFFPHLNEIVFAPFGIPEKSIRYLVYKILYLLHIPLCSVFWGEWKKHLKSARQVIIFDYGYQRGMETYIKKVNPSCQVYLFCWNTITKGRKNHILFTDKNAIYSTDKNDCKKYNLKYNHIFYTRALGRPCSEQLKNHLFFLGADKGRAPFIHALKPILEESGLICDIRVITDSKNPAYLRSLSDILTQTTLNYEEYCRELDRCGVLLDIYQKGQTAITMRVLEAIYHSKKLITTNEDIVHYDFYNDNNIYLLPPKLSSSTAASIRAFLDRPFLPYSEEILAGYDFEHWKRQFSRT